MDYNKLLKDNPSSDNVAHYLYSIKDYSLNIARKKGVRESDVEDVHQEVVFRVIKKYMNNGIDLSRNNSPTKTIDNYFTECLRNHIYDNYRKNERRDNYLRSEHPFGYIPIVPEPSERLEKEETSKLVRETVDNLPDKFRNIVKKKYFLGFKLKEITESENISDSWYCNRIRKSLEMLRIRLRDAV